MRMRKYLVALASWRRQESQGLRKEVGNSFYLVFSLGPRGGLKYIMAVPLERIDKLGPNALTNDYEIKPAQDIYGPFLTSEVLAREIKLNMVFREDLLEKVLKY